MYKVQLSYQLETDIAINLYNIALASSPEDPQLLADLASYLHIAEMPEDALEYIRKSIELAPDVPEYHATLGYILLSLVEIPDARKSLITALDMEPTHVKAHVNLASILIAEQNYVEALWHLKVAESLSSKSIGTFILLASLHTKMKEMERALDYYNRAACLIKTEGTIKIATLIYRRRAEIKSKLGQIQGARADRLMARRMENG